MASTTLLLLLALGLFVAAVVRLLMVLPLWHSRKKATATPRATASMLAVLGSGGHTAEMFRLLRTMDGSKYSRRVYVVAATDQLSSSKANEFEASIHGGSYSIVVIPRSREVGQSYWTSVFTTLYACAASLRVVFATAPDVILTNGPGTAVPICLAAVLAKFVGWKDISIIYIESICRVKALSLSARLLYLIVDRMFVQWPELAKRYPKAEYHGFLSH